MAQTSKTGGSTGTNQYQIRGSSVATVPVVEGPGLIGQLDSPPNATRSSKVDPPSLQQSMREIMEARSDMSEPEWCEHVIGMLKDPCCSPDLLDSVVTGKATWLLDNIGDAGMYTTNTEMGSSTAQLAVYTSAASNPALPLPSMRHIADKYPSSNIDRSYYMTADKLQAAIARNPSCPSDVLDKLYQTGVQSIRASVLSNPRCPPKLLAHASKLKSRLVTVALGSPNCPPEVLRKLSQTYRNHIDKMNLMTAHGLVRNKNTDPATVRAIMDHTTDNQCGDINWFNRVFSDGLNHPSITADDRDTYFRQILKNPRLNQKDRQRICGHPYAPIYLRGLYQLMDG